MIEPVEQADIGARIIQGDCLERLKELPDNSIDSCVTDPPAAISFMGKSWDGDRGGRTQWVTWLSEVDECPEEGGTYSPTELEEFSGRLPF